MQGLSHRPRALHPLRLHACHGDGGDDVLHRAAAAQVVHRPAEALQQGTHGDRPSGLRGMEWKWK